MDKLTTQTVFALRKEGRLDDALPMARLIYKQSPTDSWAIKALGYCLYDAVKRANERQDANELRALVDEFSAMKIDEYEDGVLWKCQQIAIDMADPTSEVRQKAKELSKRGNHAQAAEFLRSALKDSPNHFALQESLGWELYRLIKAESSVTTGAILLREYASLKQIHNQGLLHSLMLGVSLQWADTWDKFMGFVKWWDLENLRFEDFSRDWNKDHSDQYPSLAEKTVIALYKHIKRYKLRSNKLKWVLDFIIKVTEKSDDEWMPYRLAKLSAWLGGDLALVRKELIPLARKKDREFWMWEALAEVSENSSQKMACFAKAFLCKAQNESYKVELYHIFMHYLVDEKQYAAASAVARVYSSIQQKNKRPIVTDVQAFLSSDLYSSDESFDLNGFCASKATLSDEILTDDLPWVNASFLALVKSSDNRPPIVRVSLEKNQAIGLKVGSLSRFDFNKGDAIKIKMSQGSVESKLFKLHQIQRREGSPYDCIPSCSGVVSRINTDKELACVSLNYRDVVLLHYDRHPKARELIAGDCISIKVEKNSKTGQFYPVIWSKKSRAEINQLFVKFSGTIDIQHGNPFGFVRARGIDIFISPPQIKSLNLKDDDEISGWAIKGINKKKNKVSWSALLINGNGLG